MLPVTSIAFFIFTILIVVLSFQVHENYRITRDEIATDQDRVQEAARLLLEAVNTEHPFFKLTGIIESKLIMDELVKRHHGALKAESRLGLHGRNEFQKLRKHINDFHTTVIQELMDKIITVAPHLNFEYNEIAGLTKSRKHRAMAKPSTISSQG